MKKKHQKNVGIKRFALYLPAMFVVSAAAQGCEEESLGPDVQQTESGIQLGSQRPKDDSQESEPVLAELETSDSGTLLPSDKKATDRPEEISISSSLVSKDTLIIMNGRLCTGSRNCENAKDVDQCEQMMGCSYVALAGYYFECYGDATSCSVFIRQDSCESQLGCRWVECETDADCRGDAYCNSFGRCLQPKCADDEDCPAGQYCVNPGDSDSKCVICRNHSDCADNLYCMNPGSSSSGCVTCRNDFDCSTGLHCLNNASCVECISDSNCLATEYCKEGVCQERKELEEACSNNTECISRICDMGPCGRKCIPDADTGEYGDYCTHNHQCDSGACFVDTQGCNGRCGCETDSECGNGRRCRDDHQCVTANGEDGTPCSADGQCINACIDGTCQPRRGLEEPCYNNADCVSRICDMGPCGRKCIPDADTGKNGNYCTHNHQCDSGVCRVDNNGCNGTCIGNQ